MKNEIPTFRYEREKDIFSDNLKVGEAFNYDNKWIVRYFEEKKENSVVKSLRIITLNGSPTPLVTRQSEPVHKKRFANHVVTWIPIPDKGQMPRVTIEGCQVNFHRRLEGGEEFLKLVFTKRPSDYEKINGVPTPELADHLVQLNKTH